MGKRISRKTLLLIVCGGLLLVILLYLLLMGVKGDGLGFLFLYNSGIVGRLTLSSSAGVFLVLICFPLVMDTWDLVQFHIFVGYVWFGVFGKFGSFDNGIY